MSTKTVVVNDELDWLYGGSGVEPKVATKARPFAGTPVHSLDALPRVGEGKYFYYMVVRNGAPPTHEPKRCGSPRTLKKLAPEFDRHNVVLFSTTYRPPCKHKRTKPRH